MSRDGWVALPRGAIGCLRFVIVVFPDHTHYLRSIRRKKESHMQILHNLDVWQDETELSHLLHHQ